MKKWGGDNARKDIKNQQIKEKEKTYGVGTIHGSWVLLNPSMKEE